MAEKRCISKVISISEKVNELPDIFDMLLFTWLIPHTDDFGRMAGSPGKVKSLVVPMLDKTKSEVQESLANLHNAGLIIWYENDGDKVIQIVNFEQHQSGLHKRTKSKFPDPPRNSGKFTEIPLEGKGTEEKRTGREEEQKGMEGSSEPPPISPIPSPDSNPHKDHIHKLVNECQISEYNLFHLDEIFSYIGMVDLEVIEAAIKKGQGKHINYTLKTLKGMVKDGVTKKEHVHPTPEPGQAPPNNVTPIRRNGGGGFSRKPQVPIVQQESQRKPPMSDEELKKLITLTAKVGNKPIPTGSELEQKMREWRQKEAEEAMRHG